MGTEIERKYLVVNDDWRAGADAGTPFRQGYLGGPIPASVRVRIEGDRAKINIKSGSLSIRRQEYEYEIPVDDAEEMLGTLCGGVVEKVRYRIQYRGFTWEVDVFEGANRGLVMAEVELDHEDERPPLPPWVGQDVSNEPRYYNVCLVEHPYGQWDLYER